MSKKSYLYKLLAVQISIGLLVAGILTACSDQTSLANQLEAAPTTSEPATPSNKNVGSGLNPSSPIKNPDQDFNPDFNPAISIPAPVPTPTSAGVVAGSSKYEGEITVAPTARPTVAATRPPTASQPPATIAATRPAYPAPALNLPPLGPIKMTRFQAKGNVGEGQFKSNLLDKPVTYHIYLPREYASQPDLRYSVLYMLHGYSGMVDEWEWYGLLQRMDDLVETNNIRPFIIVLPMGEQEYWVDHPANGARWGEYLAHEVVDHIDGNFRTIPLKNSRAIGGLSMGAAGALQISMSYPGIFGIVGAHSPSLRTFDQSLPWWGDRQWFDRYDPVTMARTNPYLAQVKLWVDIGLDDRAWRSRALQFKSVLESRKLNFKWMDYPGDHNADYWTAHSLDYLNWYGNVLSVPQV